MHQIKVWLDYKGVAPRGWVQVRWCHDIEVLLRDRMVSHLAVGDSLGDEAIRGSAVSLYTVLDILEREYMRMAAPILSCVATNECKKARILASFATISKKIGRNVE